MSLINKKTKTLWSTMIHYFRTEKIGNIVTRVDLVAFFLDWCETDSTEVVDVYRNYLTKAGYLERVDRGVYKVIKFPEAKLTLEQCKDLAYKRKEEQKKAIKIMKLII